jgi:C-terminal processing protease CtpA/Prc
MGAALPAHTQKLPNGDVFMFAVADFIGPAGKTIEGTGVVPNTHVELTRTRLQEEWDPDLKSAVDWIIQEPSE